MLAYLDSSVVIRYILAGDIGIKHAFEFPRLVSSELLEIEARRTLSRCRMQYGLDDTSYVLALERLESTLEMVDLVELNGTIKRRAMESFPVLVSTADAFHLSTALALAAQEAPAGIQVFSYGTSMQLCARALGFGSPLGS